MIDIAAIAAIGSAVAATCAAVLTYHLVNDQRRIGRVQTQAYVVADAAHFVRDDTFPIFGITLTIANSGGSPIKWYEVHFNVRYLPLNETAAPKRFTPCEGGWNVARWRGFPNGESRTVLLNYPGIDQVISRSLRITISQKIVIEGAVVYETMWGEEFFSEFFFTSPASSGPTVGDQPHRMSAHPADLLVYQPIDHRSCGFRVRGNPDH
ncbi:hypothetical protein DLJ53_18165 [Acuticoccus sediminis]|uniref:Uncharacterized protein n=1 Tax=Acuticoccus sediminis TaxID=2184697 RepID=A0A8B2NR38_9HYPH|nr:hypothetical protein [Acuticoccus sediminis]RAI01142.1 hypothetical protein DLJ53_18165 [Acuticoccus sediminis]